MLSITCVKANLSNIQSVRDVISLIKFMKSESIDRPFVVASFAQSLDGFMAPWLDEDNRVTESNYQLSGDGSLLLTHAIRSEVDAILIGGRTLSIDNPMLTNRMWADENRNYHQPQAVILDTNLDHIQSVKSRIKNPILCCSYAAASRAQELPENVTILPCDCNSDGKLSVLDVLSKLRRRFGIQSIMVEGGAAVLSSFFSQNLVDLVCITVSPKYLISGISPSFTVNNVRKPIDLSYSMTRTLILGHDFVVLSSWPPAEK
jgi:riboflavin-specific deaminase-like protein